MGAQSLPEHVEQRVQHADAARDGQKDGVSLHEYALQRRVNLPERARVASSACTFISSPSPSCIVPHDSCSRKLQRAQ